MGVTMRDGFWEKQTVRDLWRQRDLGQFDDVFRTRVPAHGVVLLKVSPGNTRSSIIPGP